jgi:hypothetical protein
MSTPPIIHAYHAFTDDGCAYTGVVAKFKLTTKELSFAYEYDFKGVKVTGTFSGRRDSTKDVDVVGGGWEEHSEKPIDGKTTWTGNAQLFVRQVPDRHIVAGVWRMPGITERWVVDAPI